MTYSGFYCFDTLQQAYLILSTLILFAGVCIAWFGSGNSPNAANIRNIGFSILVTLGIIPASREFSLHY